MFVPEQIKQVMGNEDPSLENIINYHTTDKGYNIKEWASMLSAFVWNSTDVCDAIIEFFMLDVLGKTLVGGRFM